ncbi:MAG: hypothetical protein GY861_08800 [bacterium]|nr:hypothetical protein [bacterium]
MKKIAGIPIAIVNNHNEALYPWYKHGIEDAILFHVDGHSDMAGGISFAEKIDKKYAKETLDISHFICSAFHHGIVSSIYWLNPHSEEKRLQDLGTRDTGNGRTSIKTAVFDYENIIFKELSGKRIRWDNEFPDYDSENTPTPEKINLENRVMILDIDLDAFCCHTHISNMRRSYDGVENYEQRIDDTMDLLRKLKAPALITIARSQGARPGGLKTYVPMDKVDEVQKKTLTGLAAVYS